ncbi:MAG TPA: hypothetical protein VMT94_02905 [Burkholderiales bacterium]|nr:hypothetical protein [Burkholderiales bacterium]
MSDIDLETLKKPLLALCIVIAAGAGAIYYTDQLLQQAALDLAQKKRQLQEAHTRLQKSGDEKETIVRYLDSYHYLQQLGFAGDERRIDWIDALRLTNQQMQLFGIDYQISAQQSYPYAGELGPGQVTLHQSVMKINLGLLHEGDLMKFLTALAQQNAGIFSVNQCMLTRANTGGSIRYQPNLRAECELAWITAKPEGPSS